MRASRHILLAVAYATAPIPAAAQVFTWEEPRVEIPDGDAQGIALPLDVSGVAGTISAVHFSIDGGGPATRVWGDANNGIDHPAPGELSATLISPAGTAVKLFDQPPLAATDRNIGFALFDDNASKAFHDAFGESPFFGTYRPLQPFSSFQGENPNGTWTLLLADRQAGDAGGVSRWSVHLHTGGDAAGTAPFAAVGLPATDRAVANTSAFVTLLGGAADFDGTVASVRVRRMLDGDDPASVPWQQATQFAEGWSFWSFASALEVGANRFEVQALDDSGLAGPVFVREIVRKRPIFDGPKPDHAYLDPQSAVRVALTRNEGVTPLALWNVSTGYAHDALTGWAALSADVNGDGLADLLTVTPFGDVWISFNNGEGLFTGNFLSASGYVFNEYEGWGVFTGDFNGDGFADLLQVAPGGQLHVGWSNGTSIAAPQFLATTGFSHLPNESHWIGVADVTGDGRDDVVYSAPDGAIWVASATETGFAASQNWIDTGFFRYRRGTVSEPFTATLVFLADINGDGRTDVGYLNEVGTTWICRSTGTSFQAPDPSGETGFLFAPFLGFGWNVFTADINADAMEDLISIDQFGRVHVALSNGNAFVTQQEALTDQPMYHNILGPRRIFVRHFGD